MDRAEGKSDLLWEVRVHWRAESGATCLDSTVHIVNGETQAIDAAVAALDGCRHPWAPVRATSAEIRRSAGIGAWRPVAFTRSYL
jgi:hypothetical protein